MSRLLWMAFQATIVGFFVWLWAAVPGDPGRLSLHMAVGLGVLAAFLATAVPIIAKDVLVGQWQLWRSIVLRRSQRTARGPAETRQTTSRIGLD